MAESAAELKNILYKDTHLKITRKQGMIDGGMPRVHGEVEVELIGAGDPPKSKHVRLETANDSVDITGTYGLRPQDWFDPNKEMSNTMWLAAYQKGLVKDVTAILAHADLGHIMVTVNNPMIGKPNAILYSCVAEGASGGGRIAGGWKRDTI